MALDSNSFLRHWARKQYEYDRRQPSLTSAELSELAGLELRDTARTGHCNLRAFFSLEGDFPELASRPETLSDLHLLEIAFRTLSRYRQLGATAGGLLPEYVGAQMVHLQECGDCRRRVCAHLRRSGGEYRKFLRLIAPLRPG